MKNDIICSFSSRRNRVRLIEGCDGPVVEKSFACAQDADHEAAIYRLLEGSELKAARLLKQEGTRLILSFLEGENYLALLERQEKEGLSLEPWIGLLEWITSFHQVTGLIQRDMNLRNFLWHDGVAAGIDFEDCGLENVTAMPAQLAAYVLLYERPHTETKERIAACIQSYAVQSLHCNEHEYTEQFAQALEMLNQRRRSRKR